MFHFEGTLRMSEPIVISGTGLVTPVENPWESIKQGKSWQEKGARVDVAAFAFKLRKTKCAQGIVRQMDAVHQMCLLACTAALNEAKVKLNKKVDPHRIAIVLGTEYGDLDIYETFERNRTPAAFRSALPGTPGLANSIALKFYGPSTTLLSQFSAGLEAVVWGLEALERGDVDLILCGGFDKLAPSVLKRYELTGMLSQKGVSRPYDRRRDGLLLSEGAGIIVMEKEFQAKQRGVRGLARVVGRGMRFGNGRESIASAMRQALQSATLSTVDCVFGSANSCPKLDSEEARAIREILGEVPVTSVKSVAGESLGMGGVLNLVSGIWSIKEGLIPGTINFKEPCRDCPVNVVAESRMERPRSVMVNAVGTNAVSVVLKKIEA